MTHNTSLCQLPVSLILTLPVRLNQLTKTQRDTTAHPHAHNATLYTIIQTIYWWFLKSKCVEPLENEFVQNLKINVIQYDLRIYQSVCFNESKYKIVHMVSVTYLLIWWCHWSFIAYIIWLQNSAHFLQPKTLHFIEISINRV